MYYEILQQKMSKPIKRKRKKKENFQEEPYGEYGDEVPLQGNIFKVEVDKKAF
jgi:hypothetical protein